MKLMIIQARMGSSRLPGKVLKLIEKKKILDILLERVKMAKNVDKIVVATSTNYKDKKIVNFCKERNVDVFCGSEEDVLDRYFNCAKVYKADTIIRITSDCPLIDPEIVDNVIELYFKERADYSANTIPPDTRKWPDGSDVEVFSMSSLEKAFFHAVGIDREHVTFYFWKTNNSFKTVQLKNKYDWSKYRYTLDYKEDFIRLTNIIKKINEEKIFGNTAEIVDIIDRNFKDDLSDKKFNFGHGWNNN